MRRFSCFLLGIFLFPLLGSARYQARSIDFRQDAHFPSCAEPASTFAGSASIHNVRFCHFIHILFLFFSHLLKSSSLAMFDSSPLEVPKQRSFAANPTKVRRRFSDTFFQKQPLPSRRTVSEKPPNLLQADLLRSLRYNTDWSSAVASYNPGSLRLEDIPNVPVYNRATGKFRVFSDKLRPRRVQSEEVRRSYLSLEDSNSFDLNKQTFDENRLRYKSELPPLPSDSDGSSEEESELFSSNPSSKYSYSEEGLPRQPPPERKNHLDDLSGNFLQHIPRRSVSTISTCRTYELYNFGSDIDSHSVLTSAESIASEGSLWIPQPASGVTQRSSEDAPLQYSLPAQSKISLFTSPKTLLPPDSASMAQLSPSKSPMTSYSSPEKSDAIFLPKEHRFSSLPNKSLPPVPTKPNTYTRPNSICPKDSKKVTFCLDLGAEYDKSRFMIPKEYKLLSQERFSKVAPKPRDTKQERVKPRAVSQPNPSLQPIALRKTVDLSSKPLPPPKSAPVSNPASQPVSPSRQTKFEPIPFRTNVRIMGPI